MSVIIVSAPESSEAALRNGYILVEPADSSGAAPPGCARPTGRPALTVVRGYGRLNAELLAFVDEQAKSLSGLLRTRCAA